MKLAVGALFVCLLLLPLLGGSGTLTVTKASSTISISLGYVLPPVTYPSVITLGSGTRITGEISPAHGLASVTIYYRVRGTTTWNMLATTITSPGGAYFGIYAYEWIPSSSGTYEIKASWSGDSDHNGAESSIQTLTVKNASS